MNPSFVKAISEMLGKSSKKTSHTTGAGTPLSADELLLRSKRSNPTQTDPTTGQQFRGASKSTDSLVDFNYEQELRPSLMTPAKADFKSPFKKRLKIAVLHRNFDPTAGGAEHYAVALVECLANQHEFHIFSQKSNHNWPFVNYHRVPQFFNRPRWLNQLFYATYCAWATRSGFDVVHSHENTWHADVQTVHVLPLTHNLFAGKSVLQKTVQWLKVLFSPRLLTYVLLEKARFKNKSGRWFVAVSANLNRLLEYSMGCESAALITIAPGVYVGDTLNQGERAVKRMHARASLGLPEFGACMLWVGHDAQKKGLDTAVKALSLLPSDCVLVIAGAAKPRDFWSKIATQGVQNRIIEKGVLGEQELQDLYAACDLLIHPTREDTFGMVVLEAMANALPVIVSGAQYCGISSELTDAKTALILSDPEDPEELAGKVVLALQGHMKESLSTQGQSWAKTQDWKKMAELQNTVYTHIAYHLGEQAPAVK